MSNSDPPARHGHPALLSAVVPFFDEQENLARYPRELWPALDALGVPWEAVLVDDGSRDGSLAVARRLAAEGVPPGGRGRDIRVEVHDRNRGLGAAVRTGLAAARGDAILTLDADLTFDPRQAGHLLERYAAGDVDVVIGSPVLAGYAADVPRYRVVLSQGANVLYQMALGRRLTAVTPIFRLYRAAALRDLPLESERFEINAEILARMLFRGARAAEVPATLTTRVHGISKLDNLAEIRNHLRLLAKIVRWRWTARRSSGAEGARA